LIGKKQNCVKKGYLNIAEKSIGSSIEDQKKTLEKG
tara:strand:- start:843 stop:950 length:108 start_codon:yes stop_codon:yes gene_type:complete